MPTRPQPSVGGVVEPTLLAAEIRRSVARLTTDLSAYDLYLRAHGLLPDYERAGFQGSEFAGAGNRDRSALRASAVLGVALPPHLVGDGWAENPDTSRRKARDLARQALLVEENAPGVLANPDYVLEYFGEDIGAMIGLVDCALALNPSCARGWYLSGIIRLFAGRSDLAIAHIETSLRLSPRERMGYP